MEAELKKHRIKHRIFRYDAGHGFFAGFFKDKYPFLEQHPSYNPEAAPDAWKHVLDCFKTTCDIGYKLANNLPLKMFVVGTSVLILFV
ncbi:dienelactone hydrolase family protein [Nostoc sp. HG1]|nr:dienelactone hydrolase family protein [Nostoc sp. HG1]